MRSTSAEQILARLRGDVDERPLLDPGLSGGLRAWLEDEMLGLAGVEGGLRSHSTSSGFRVRLDARGLRPDPDPEAVSAAYAREALLGALFRQWNVVGSIGDPMGDALAALTGGADGDRVVRWVARLPRSRRHRLADRLDRDAGVIADKWPAPHPSWRPRSADRFQIPLAGGAVVLAAQVDLSLGGPAGDRAAVCLVGVHGGLDDTGAMQFLRTMSVLETLRSGAPPFQLATFSTASGELSTYPISQSSLVESLTELLVAIGRICGRPIGFMTEAS